MAAREETEVQLRSGSKGRRWWWLQAREEDEDNGRVVAGSLDEARWLSTTKRWAKPSTVGDGREGCGGG